MDTVEKLDCISYIGRFCTLDTPLQCFGEGPGEGLDLFFNGVRWLAPNRQHCDSERGLTRGEKVLPAVDLGLLMGCPYKPSVPLRRKKEKPAPRARARQAFKKGRALRSPLGVLGVLGGKIPLCLCASVVKKTPYSSRPCASTAATAAIATISSTSSPACSTCTGMPMPNRIGPMASASVSRDSSL